MKLVRRAQISDVAELVACVDAAYLSAKQLGIKLPPVSEGLDQDILDHLVWVAPDEHRIVGMIVVSVSGNQAHLMNIAVHPDAAGQGVAKSLIKTAFAELRRLSVARIDLATHVEMPDNVALYAHLGWVETGRSETKVYMSRDID
jgi:ribosomal protein S18 acetylase RimI-like enzyme